MRESEVRILSGVLYNPDWSRIVKTKGYRAIYFPEHPRSWSTGYVYLHRVVMELKIGRILNEEEVVHHKDENRSNNSPDNLEIKSSQAEHAKEHKQGRRMLLLRCPECHSEFERERRQTHVIKPSTLGATFCSASCRGRFSRSKQTNGLTKAMSREVVRNVIREFIR